jgi:hypothetical protein
MTIFPYPINFQGKQETQMTEEEVRALLEKIELEKQFPSFTELRKRVIQSLPRLLDRPCPELIRLIPSFPHHVTLMPEIEAVATRLINSGTTVITPEGKRVSFPGARTSSPPPENFYGSSNGIRASRQDGSINVNYLSISPPLDGVGEFDSLRAKVLEALPVLVGWLVAHRIMTSIPIFPFSAEHMERVAPGSSFRSPLTFF